MTEQNTLSISELQQQVNAGDALAQYDLARHYAECEHFDLAFEWFRKAAEQGFAEAQYELAIGYFHRGNPPKLVEWLEKAAEQGHVEAISRLKEFKDPDFCVQIASSYSIGVDGFERNANLAFKWFFYAATHGGSAIGNFEVARHILEGKVVAYDEKGAVIENGLDEFAFAKLKKADELCGDIKQYEIIKKGVNCLLAACYDQGIGIKKNRELAQFHRQLGIDESDIKKVYESYLDLPSQFTKESLGEIVANNFEDNTDLTQKLIEHAFKDSKGEQEFKKFSLLASKEIAKKNQELEAKNKQLTEAQKELEDMMSMFAHKFRSPLDAIIYNTTHENQVKLYTEAAQTMRGLLNIFSIISTDAEILKDKIKQDRLGNGRLAGVFSKTLDMILLHLLSVSGAEKIQQHYMAYAKAHGQCDADVNYKNWCEDYFELEQALQAEWEQSFALLLNQSATLEQRLAWLEQHFFKLKLIGFERSDIQFKEYGVTESFLTILLNEILVNAFKYYSSASKHPVILEWTERDSYQVFICRNPSIRSERTIIKGSHKGQAFLSTLARKTGSIFTKPTPQDDFVVEFGIPDELLISK
ncbi:tetratricopeptide repeat protein [Methylobacter sp.]|uniref:tetratricopeptide repeat protein n=1 Tax=Methylobacter sp. TaxID=2051955 RepID=UPI002FDE646F